MIKLLHTGDIHANKTRAEDIVKLINIFIDEVKEKSIDAVLICGDFWDCAVVNNVQFAQIIAVMSKLIATVPVYMIYGTPSHEIASSLEVFAQMGANVTYKPKLWCFHKGNEKIDILGIPEPRRSDFIAKTVEETNEKINDYLNEAFNYFAVNPTVVMFHGEISGATLQNGVSSKSDTQLTKKMYGQINPIYIAASHIHSPQSFDKIVRYCGSPIPCTFGELHQPSYTLVEIEEGKANFKAIELPFSQNKVVECDYDMFQKLSKLNFKGSKVKIKLTLTAEQRKLFHIHDEAKKLKEVTNADDLTISIVSSKEVSIRSKEIIKTTSVTEKLKIYADVNNIRLTESIMSKAKEIEDNMMIAYNYPSHSFELISLSLKGAKGLFGREEINIDFTKYEDGVLALLGKNGAGKSTLIENMHPFPKMLTRSGALRTHFYLKDSHRIVIYRDENNKYYKFTIQLAAHIDTGLVKYLAETSDDEGQTWKPVKDCDGNLDTYKTYIQETFGDLSMYLRTAFFTTEATGYKDIASATKADKIELLSELLGTEQISDMHDMIKDKLKNINKEMDKYENIEESKQETETSLSNKNTNKSRLERELKEIEEELTVIENDIASTKKSEEEFNKNFAKYGDAIQIKTECENKVSDLTQHLDNLKEHKVKNDFYKNHEKQIKEYKDNYLENKNLNDSLIKVSKTLQTTVSELFDLNNEYNEAKSQYNAEQAKYDKVDDRIKDAQNSFVEIEEHCPTCGAKLSEKKRKELLRANETVQAEIESLKEFKITQKNIVAEAKKKYTSLKTKVDKMKEKEKELHTQYDEADSKYQASRVYLDMNSEYESYINYVPVDNLETDIEKVSKDLDNTKAMLETLSGVEIIDYKAKLEELEYNRKDKENDRLQCSMDIASVSTQIEQLEETLETMIEQSKIMKELSKEYEEYSILEQAFSNGGIQALELEAAAPSIAELTNTILHESYGDKFIVSFSTLKESRNKIIDDFSIDILNTETGFTTPLDMLSKGEKVWIQQALYYAFSIIRAERTNFCFKVRFVDESDGGLDGDVRLQYFKMIESAHKAGNARLTVLITHSQEIKDIVQQTIQL